MRELLERWAQLEPKRLDLQENPSGLPVIAFGGQKFYSLGGPVSNAVVLAAAIEAITARGWEWSLWSDGNEVSGDITIRDDDTGLGRVHGSGLKQLFTPAEALLTAYLNAVEAQP